MPPRPRYHLPSAPPTRHFSTTPISHKVSPESPQFVQIPQPPRLPQPWKPRPKGQLPTPKSLFRPSNPDKASPDTIALSTLEPKSPPTPNTTNPELTAFIQWKSRMATHRRQNLREGLTELHEKHKHLEETLAKISSARNAEREVLLAKQAREDVRLTLPSVLSTVRNNGPILDPNRHERIEKKKLLHKQKEKIKRQEQMEQIHELYLHSSSFILTEKQLDEAIAAEFPDMSITGEGAKFLPMTVSEMLAKRVETPTALSGSSNRSNELTLEVAAALTGGKLPSDVLEILNKAETARVWSDE